MVPVKSILTEYLYQALSAQYGIVISVSSVHAAVSALHNARSDAQDLALRGLHFRVSPIIPNEIWIVKNAPQGNPSAEAPSRSSV